jgi:CO dehydrogenase/acetyl-CoA synthase epsilon subunit
MNYIYKNTKELIERIMKYIRDTKIDAVLTSWGSIKFLVDKKIEILE